MRGKTCSIVGFNHRDGYAGPPTRVSKIPTIPFPFEFESNQPNDNSVDFGKR